MCYTFGGKKGNSDELMLSERAGGKVLSRIPDQKSGGGGKGFNRGGKIVSLHRREERDFLAKLVPWDLPCVCVCVPESNRLIRSSTLLVGL